MFTRLSSSYPRPSTPSRSCPRLSAACLGRYAAVWVVCGLSAALGAQSAAPFNDSIRVADLRADLFFLRGRRVQGAARRHARERAGRRVGAFPFRACRVEAGCAERVVRAEHTTDGGHARRGQPAGRALPDGTTLSLRNGAGLLSAALQRERHGAGGGRLRGFRHSRARSCSTTTTAMRVKGRIALILEHEPGERDRGEPVRRRGHRGGGRRDQEGAGGAGEGCHRRPVRHRRAQPSGGAELRGIGARVLAARGRRASIASRWPAGATACGFPSARSRRRSPRRWSRGTGRSLMELSKAAETAGGYAGLPLDGVQVTLTASVRRHIVADRNMIAMVEGCGPGSSRTRSSSCQRTTTTKAPTAPSSTTAPTMTARGRWRCWRLPTRMRWRWRRDSGPVARCYSHAGARKSAARCSAPGRTPRSRPFPLARTVAVLNMDMVGRNEEVQLGGGPRFNGLEVQTAESNRERGQHPRLQPAPGAERPGRAGQQGIASGSS